MAILFVVPWLSFDLWKQLFQITLNYFRYFASIRNLKEQQKSKPCSCDESFLQIILTLQKTFDDRKIVLRFKLCKIIFYEEMITVITNMWGENVQRHLISSSGKINWKTNKSEVVQTVILYLFAMPRFFRRLDVHTYVSSKNAYIAGNLGF